MRIRDSEARADAPSIGRRRFLKLTMMAGGSLALGIAPLTGRTQVATGRPPSPPQAFLIIAPDNTVTVAVNRLESGQGVQTALPMALADELDADWRNVRAVLAPAGEPYKDPVSGVQMTGGSTSLNHSYTQYRELGACARAMLIGAAARRWNVAPDTCRTANGVVTSGSNRATYGELAPAAMAMPVPRQVALKDPSQFRIIGTPTPRLDTPAKLDGTLKYGADWNLPGTRVALVARPPRFGGQVAGYNAAAARAIKGVVDVVQVPSGVAVIADGYWPAKLGRDALGVTWADTGSTVSSRELMNRYKQLATQPGTVVRPADVGAIPAAATRIQADYEFPYLAHAAMEPLSCTVDVGAPNCDCGVKVWVSSQLPEADRLAVANALQVSPDKIQVFTMMAGGSFGRRAAPSSDYVIEAAHVANAYTNAGHLGPVKVIWSREDDMRGGHYRPMTLHRVDVGLDAKGQVLGWNHVVVAQPLPAGTPFGKPATGAGSDGEMAAGLVDNPYSLPLQVSVHQPAGDVPVQWWRSAGHAPSAFVKETMVDEFALAARQDPVAYRLAHLGGPQQARQRQALQLAVDKSGYGKRALPAGHAWGVAVHESFGTAVAYVTEVSIDQGQPRVHRVTAGVHANRVVNPLGASAQIEGGALFGLSTIKPGFAIDIENGAAANSNFTDYPPLRMQEAPPVDVFFVPSEATPTGLAESGVPPIAPAVANAVYALNGQRMRALPFAPLAAVPAAEIVEEPPADVLAGDCRLPRKPRPAILKPRVSQSQAGVGQASPVPRPPRPKRRVAIPCADPAMKGPMT
jgi:isoquinoline 1-oxidoreductase subunit beta